jgi:hypothetical protein
MSDTPLEIPTPTIQEIEAAHRAFEESEPRDLFYRAATELMGLALRGETSLSVTEALAVLLQTWNRTFYRFTPFDAKHFSDLDLAVTRHKEELAILRGRSIERYSEEDRTLLREVFADFEEVLGPVGAAKALHLLAPGFFPLWDRAIASAYGLPMRPRGKNADRYRRFMRITQMQYEVLPGVQDVKPNPLKALDEYNYCKYTKHWT